MEKKLEQLLNSLVDKGRKPRGLTPMWKIEVDYDIYFAFDVYDSLQCWHFSPRSLVSKESWLWQFVCENELYPPYIQHRWFRDLSTNWLQIHDYRYWVIESSLKDESELEEFLLDNILIH